MTLFSAIIIFFMVMDPVGNIPCFMSALKNVPAERRRFIIIRENIIALAAIVVFLFAGTYILRVLQISEPALTMAGGIVLFLIALRMIFPLPHSDEEFEQEPFIFPLAIPYLAGPSLMAMEMLIMSRAPNRWQEWLAAVVIAWIASGIILLFSPSIISIAGEKVVKASERLMGLVLTAVSIEMIMKGIIKFMSAYKN